MAKLSIQAGATSQSVTVFIQDSSVTTGAGKTGLAYNTASLTAYYTHAGANATANAITLATLAAVNSAYSSGGFKEIDATNMPGVYRLDLPDAVLATSKGRSAVVILKGAANMAPCVLEIELTGMDNQAAVVPANVTQFGGSNGTFSGGRPEVNTTHFGGSALTQSGGRPEINMSHIAGSAVNTASAQLGVNVVNAAGTAWNSGAIGASTLATDTITAAKIAADAIGASELATDAVTEIASGVWANATRTLSANTNLNDLSAAGVRAAIGMASANMDTQLSAIAGYIDTEVGAVKAVTDKLDSAMELDSTVYRFTANALEQAPTGGSAPTAAAIRAEIDANSTQLAAIKAKTDNLPADPADASDIASSFSTVNTKLDTIDDFLDTEVAAIKAKTDSLTFSVAGKVDANIKYVADTAVTGSGTSESPWGP